MLTGFRHRICEVAGVVPFPHQASWWLASDGLQLTDELVGEDDPNGFNVRVGKEQVERRGVIPRAGGRARVLADLGAFKIGKSYGAALWAAAFAAIENARVVLVGVEYDICAPEFEYILEFLLSSKGLGLTASSLQNRPKDGRMWLEFENGARFEARSWERSESMKGKEIDCYVYCEAYMLPGLECYTSFSQNLRVRDGYAVFATTPDRPWVNELHNKAHSGEKEFANWHCTCSVHSSQNPFSYSKDAMDRDRSLMTREKFAIHYEGKLGDFVGRVYAYQRGERQFSPTSHPHLFDSEGRIKVPDGYEVVGGADTGTYSSALLIMFSPEGEAFVIDEFPNYRYLAGTAERFDMLTIPEWAGDIYQSVLRLGLKNPTFWADKNSQFKRELASYRDFTITLQANTIPMEARTEIAREYFTQNKIWFAPWLTVLPFELENAAWPEEASATGRYQRVKDRDHTLDPFEHILSRRPSGPGVRTAARYGTWVENYLGKAFKSRQHRDIHLGRG
jgi:hypothetical protein